MKCGEEEGGGNGSEISRVGDALRAGDHLNGALKIQQKFARDRKAGEKPFLGPYPLQSSEQIRAHSKWM